jgi:hypothetical protein
MATAVSRTETETAPRRIEPLHWLLAFQSFVIILASINRLTTLTLGYAAANEYLRWVDLTNMLVFPLASMVGFYLLKKQMEYHNPALNPRVHLLLNVIFLVGVYLLAASYGDHEVTNYLHQRFCTPDDSSALCRIIIYNDDEFSHFVFFAGFVLVNAVMLLYQLAFPWQAKLTRRDKILLVVNALFIGAGIFANLAFEEIGLDLYVVAILAVLSLGLLWRRGAQPLIIYYSTAYTLGLIATFLYKTLRG